MSAVAVRRPRTRTSRAASSELLTSSELDTLVREYSELTEAKSVPAHPDLSQLGEALDAFQREILSAIELTHQLTSSPAHELVDDSGIIEDILTSEQFETFLDDHLAASSHEIARLASYCVHRWTMVCIDGQHYGQCAECGMPESVLLHVSAPPAAIVTGNSPAKMQRKRASRKQPVQIPFAFACQHRYTFVRVGSLVSGQCSVCLERREWSR